MIGVMCTVARLSPALANLFPYVCTRVCVLFNLQRVSILSVFFSNTASFFLLFFFFISLFYRATDCESDFSLHDFFFVSLSCLSVLCSQLFVRIDVSTQPYNVCMNLQILRFSNSLNKSCANKIGKNSEQTQHGTYDEVKRRFPFLMWQVHTYF